MLRREKSMRLAWLEMMGQPGLRERYRGRGGCRSGEGR